MYQQVRRESSRMVSDMQVLYKAAGSRADRKIRVAVYCRVSTNLKVQERSLELQMASFRQRIAEHPGWVLAGIYADKGLTGTTAKGRIEFQRLMQDAAEGKIDYILAKSISRFARNTVDALSYTRRLQEMGVGVYFEEQRLDTLSASSEILLTIHAAFAQEESHSISENMKRSIRNRFALGIPKWSETYGYRQQEGKWWVQEEEAEVVREIFRLYVEGWALPRIGQELMRRGIRPPKGSEPAEAGGGSIWRSKTLATILHNEKYIGDVEMQKSYTVDCLTHRRVSNEKADIPKYYKKGHHEGIVDEETYQLAQRIMALKDRHRGGVQYPFYGFLKCPFCGENMLRLRLPTKKFEQAWFCQNKCGLYAVKDKYLHSAVQRAWEKYEKAGHEAPKGAVEYKFLYDHVKDLTFARSGGRVNWNRLVVHWKSGAVTTAAISYGSPSDIPCTELAKQDGWVMINGEKTTRQAAAAQCVSRVRQFVADTVVEEGEYVPTVLTPLCKCKQEQPRKECDHHAGADCT